jgi:WhiB family redox-sensing transcriptional regulator
MVGNRRRAQPPAGRSNWQAEARCRGLDVSVFYHPENERDPSRARREAAAKAICAQCPVVAQCLLWALATREPYGVWGGTSAQEREALLMGRAI